MTSIADREYRLRVHLTKAQARDLAEIGLIDRELADSKWAQWQRASMTRRRAYLERTVAARQVELDELVSRAVA
jgi:hypothetical protein